MLSDFRRSVRLELIGRSADIVFFALLVIQWELSFPNYLRRLHYLVLTGGVCQKQLLLLPLAVYFIVTPTHCCRGPESSTFSALKYGAHGGHLHYLCTDDFCYDRTRSSTKSYMMWAQQEHTNLVSYSLASGMVLLELHFWQVCGSRSWVWIACY